MKDTEIVKALECCVTKEDCDGCPYDEINDCIKGHEEDILNLINRQNAEIERLERKLVAYEPSINRVLFSQMLLEQKEKAEAFEKKWKAEVKSEAYREFWNSRPERLNEQLEGYEEFNKGWNTCLDEFCEIRNNLLKELVGEDDG